MIISIVLAKYDDIFEIFAKGYLEKMTAPLIVIDDGLTKRKYEQFNYIDSPKPFAFCKSVNLGIQLAYPMDVIIFNDDILIHTEAMDDKLHDALHSQDKMGLVAPMSTNVQNLRQHPDTKSDDSLVITENNISFVCVALNRNAIDSIGYLDEKYAEGIIGFEDVDYCLQLKQAGFRLGIAQNCLIEHGGDKFEAAISNTRRRAGNIDSTINRKYFRRKWCK